MARRDLCIGAALAALLLPGCFLPTQTSDTVQTARLRPDIAPDTVIMDLAVIERTLGDPFLNDGIWQHTDPLVVDPGRKALLEENGLRVGQIIGLTPGELLNLLKSERFCNQAQRRFLRSGHHISTRDLGPVYDHCQYDVHLGGKPLDVQMDQGRFCFDVTATHAAGGTIKLHFLPKVETGEQVLPFRPLPDQSSWEYHVERPARAYRELAWEATLRPNEYLIVGPYPSRKNTIGHRAFVQEDGPDPVQRLLVVRTARSLQSDGEPTLEEIARSSPSPPLAVQATLGAIRASRP